MINHSSNNRQYGGRERRRFVRFATHLPVTTLREDLIVGDRTDRAARCNLDLHDFSIGGLKADSPIRLKMNERLMLRLPPNGVHGPLELTGRVVHCKRQESRYEVGIRFCQTRGPDGFAVAETSSLLQGRVRGVREGSAGLAAR